VEEFIKPLGLSQNQLALNMRVSPQRINAIVRGKCGITADTALRLSVALGTSAEFWMGLQSDYDLETALDNLGDRL
jgi:antitoxin HigA-1